MKIEKNIELLKPIIPELDRIITFEEQQIEKNLLNSI